MNPPTGPISVPEPDDDSELEQFVSETAREDVRDRHSENSEVAAPIASEAVLGDVELLTSILGLPWDDETTSLMLRYAECGAFL